MVAIAFPAADPEPDEDLCAVPGCRNHYATNARGQKRSDYCKGHDRRRYRTGDPLKVRCPRCRKPFKHPQLDGGAILCPSCQGFTKCAICNSPVIDHNRKVSPRPVCTICRPVRKRRRQPPLDNPPPEQAPSSP